MKRNLFFILLVTSILLASCTNLDDINKRLDDHENRINAIEALVKNANKEIASIKTLLDAQNSKISIVSYSKLADNSGYELILSDGSKLILKNGKDGKTPRIGVKKHTDNYFYWTIDDEFIQGADGKMIKAEGQDGADGVTPKIRINAQNHWEISVDDGKTWQEILGADGNPVKAKGSDATVDLTITETEDAIIIKYKGQTFTIPKKGTSEEDPQPIRPKLPIEYISEYNLRKDGRGFVATYDNQANSKNLIHWEDVLGFFSGPDYTLVLDGVTYQLPSIKQMESIFPLNKAVCFNFAKKVLDQKETVEIAGQEIVSYNDYESVEVKDKVFIVYAIRYKDTAYESAWRYSLTNYTDPIDRTMTISVQTFEKGHHPTLEDLKDENFWSESNTKNIIKRVFPAAGSLYHGNMEPDGVGISGFYRTREKSEDGNPLIVTIDGFGVEKASYMSQGYEVSVRPWIVDNKE